MHRSRLITNLAGISRLVYLLISVALLTACSALTVSPFPTDEPPQIIIQPTDAVPPTSTTPAQATAPEAGPQDTPAPANPASPTPVDTPLPTATRPESLNAAQLPDPGQYAWTEVYSGLQFPVLLLGAGDGSGRQFIVLQGGIILAARDGQILDQPFLDISAIVNGPQNSGGYTERGLLGLAFDPEYAQNGLFYVHYSGLDRGNTVLARYRVSNDNPDRADPASAVILLTVDQPYSNHNGGTIAFGPDGMLYMGLGDGGNAGDPQGFGQNLQTLLGKILRLDVRSAEPYAIPNDNPFASGGGYPEIWAYGLRNPWRFSFDRLTGDLYIGDVGQKGWEEINFLSAGSPGGKNLGWNYREGAHPYQGEPSPDLVFYEPLTEYSHTEGCSVSGGYVVRDVNLPEWQGVYLYGDFCSGRVWGLLQIAPGRWSNDELFKTSFNISSFGEDEDGAIYLMDHSKGSIYRLEKK